MLTPCMLLTAGDEEFCIIARTGVGSRYLQTLVTPDNRKLCEKMISSIFFTDPLRMMTHQASCFLVQKLISFLQILPKFQQSNLQSVIMDDYSRLSLSMHIYHIVLNQREVFIFMLENPIMLISKYGSFVAQACLPFLQARTIIAVVNTLWCLQPRSCVGTCSSLFSCWSRRFRTPFCMHRSSWTTW